MSEAQPPTLNTMRPPHRPSSSGPLAPQAELRPGARRGRLGSGLGLAVGLCSLSLSLSLSLAGCSAPEGGSVRPRSPGIAGAPQVADDTFLIRVPPGLAAQARAELKQRLAAALERRGLLLRHTYSALVGLDGVISVRARAEDVQALLAELPELEARAAVLRYPLEVPCGDGRCAADEVETSRRDSTCSVDCGFVRERPLRDELANSWQATRVGAPAVWPVADGTGVHVAVLDSGYDRGASSAHPDRPTALGDGYSFPTKSPDFSGITSHGTHVVGIIAAPKNGVGMVGIAPGATVHPLQVFAVRMGRLGAAEDDVIAAIEQAVSMQAATKAPFIINMSLGGGRDSELEHEALRRAYAEGLLVVAAAGNTEDYTSGAVRTAPQNFPGAYGEVLSAGATDRSDNIAGFSATGPTVDISGPGVEVYSTAISGSGERQGRVTLTVDGMARRVTASLPEGSSGTTAKDVPVVDCGFGRPSEVTACAPAGKVALIQRGPAAPGETPLPFLDKVRNARLGGAVGVLLYNHRYGDTATAGAPLDSISLGTGHPVPVAGLAAGDGEYIADRLRAGRAVSVTIEALVTDYVVFDGTSMASPAVAGVAALVWSRDRTLTNVQLRQLLIESAVDLGPPGRDDLFGYGRIDAARAVAQMRPRATCGDGRLSDSSEVCDSTDLGGVTCDDLGFDSVAGGSPSCDRCVRVLGAGCACVAGRTAFDARLLLSVDTTWDGLRGTLARYQLALDGKPVRGARARVQVRSGGRLLGEYETDASDSSGAILDFIPYDGTGLPAGDYTFSPVITKGSGRCRDDQATRPTSYTVKIKS
jgi:subtilisin family serine protease